MNSIISNKENKIINESIIIIKNLIALLKSHQVDTIDKSNNVKIMILRDYF